MIGRHRALARVIGASLIGTTIEWYDFFVYAITAGIVFQTLFFRPAGPRFALVVAFASAGVAFLFRPLGAILGGYLGDRLGRRPMLIMTLLLMGSCTALVGVLPTYQQAGLLAPALLVLLRILQGLSAGGEWGGAALLVVETVPVGRRGLFGTAPQLGVPLGLILASATLGIMAKVAPGTAYAAWGWRVPFLVSVVLIGVGYYIRRQVEESPVFQSLVEHKRREHQPLHRLAHEHKTVTVLAALVLVAVQAAGYLTTGGFIQSYATDPHEPVALSRSSVMFAVVGGAVVWIIATVAGGWLSDRIGRKRTLLAGWICQLCSSVLLFPLVNTGSIAGFFLGVALMSIGLGLAYGPLPALYSELFPAGVRYSGASIAFALGAILGGAFTPAICEAILQATGSTVGITGYVVGMTLVSLVATLLLRDRTGTPLYTDAA